MSADPLEVHAFGSGDPNVYSYVRGRTLSSVDPLGLTDWWKVNLKVAETIERAVFQAPVVGGYYRAMADSGGALYEGTQRAIQDFNDDPVRATPKLVLGIAASPITLGREAIAEGRKAVTALKSGNLDATVYHGTRAAYSGTQAGGIVAGAKKLGAVRAREPSVAAQLDKALESNLDALRGPAATPVPAKPVLHGPYVHEINKGGLSSIIEEGQLISTKGKGGIGEAVRARVTPLESLQSDKSVIEFYTSRPAEVHPRNGEAAWSMAEGQRLDIQISRVRSPDGTISTPGKQ